MVSLWQGVLAGYAIAIPVGAIAILIVETALKYGFRSGFMAGAGAAAADFIYAALAALTGETLSEYLVPYNLSLRIASGLLLLAIGFLGIVRSRSKARQGEVGASPTMGGSRTFTQFLGLTLLNPLTIAYFSALILGGGASHLATTADRAAFVIGAGVASLSWQTFLAGLGALARQRLSPRFQLIASLVGSIVVIGFGVNVLWPLING